jgi:ribosome-binding factor A
LQANDTKAQQELIEVLNRAAGFFRTELAKRHTMRTTPKPRFHYDELVERGPQLEKLIGQAVSQDQARAEQTPDDDPSLFSSSATKEN